MILIFSNYFNAFKKTHYENRINRNFADILEYYHENIYEFAETDPHNTCYL